MAKFVLIVLYGLMSLPAVGSTGEEREPRPLIQVNVSVEMDAINESLKLTSESIDDISDSFQLIAESGQLDPDQQQHLLRIMENLDQLLEITSESVDALPTLVQKARDALVAQSTEVLGNLKFWSIAIIVALFTVLILAIIGLYLGVLRPLRDDIVGATANVSRMVDALESTSESLETGNTIQRKLLQLSETRG